MVVDDHPTLRDGLATIIGTQPDMKVIGAAGTGAEAVESFGRLLPDITLLDLRLPDMHGTDVIREIRKDHARARIIVLTTYLGDVQAVRSVEGRYPRVTC